MKIYMAGPLFSLAEKSFNLYVCKLLEAEGHRVYLPQRDTDQTRSERSVFLSDVAGVDWADVVIANYDGYDADSGTSWESGYAYAKGKVVIGFRSYFKDLVDGRKDGDAPSSLNLMLSESADTVVSSVSELLDVVRHIELRKYC